MSRAIGFSMLGSFSPMGGTTRRLSTGPRQKVAVFLSVFGAAVSIFVLALTASKPLPVVPMTPRAARFDGPSAIEYTRVVAEGYPDRVTGSAGARRAAQYVRSEFEKLGYRVESQRFSMWLRGERAQGENVVARLAGDTLETVAVVAHYDGQTTSHQAAEDNASGVGVLLELARVLGALPHTRGLILVSTDGEEWGMIGARALTSFFKAQRTLAVISIDYLNSGPVPALGVDCAGQSNGYSPLWLRQVIVQAGRAQAVRVVEPTPVWEWVERAVQVSAQDQGPLLRAGIAAINISTLAKDYAASRARYHTTQDVFRDFDPASFRMLGSTVEQAVLALDALQPVARPSAPRAAGNMNYLRLSSDRYLPGTTIWLMQILGLVPIGLAGVFATRNLSAEEFKSPGGAVGLFIRPLVYLVPPFLALLALYGLTAAYVLKRYELYPATPKDPFLYQVPAQVWLPLVLALFVGYFLVRKARVRLPQQPPSFDLKKQILYLWLSILVVCAFFLNPFATWLYLGGFAYASLLLLPPRGMLSRVLNALLLLGALVPFAALLYLFGKEIFLGWRILWYLVLQAAYGVWSPLAVVLFLLAAVLWVRSFAISVLRGDSREGAPAV